MLATAVAKTALEPRLARQLAELRDRESDVLRFVSHASVHDHVPLATLALAHDILTQHGEVKKIPDKREWNLVKTIISELEENYPVPFEFEDAATDLIKTYRAAAADLHRISAVIRAKDLLEKRYGKDLQSRMVEAISSIGEGNGAPHIGTILRHLNEAVEETQSEIHDNNGPAHVFTRRVEPALYAHNAIVNALSNAEVSEDMARDYVEALRTAFKERTRLRDDHEHAPLLDAAIYALTQGLGVTGMRIYAELAHIHKKDPLNVLSGDAHEDL